MQHDLATIVRDLAFAFKVVDSSAPRGSSKTREYRPGIGPLTEEAAIRAAYEYLRSMSPERYGDVTISAPYPNSKLRCDLLLPENWAIEFKLIRPFGDNGKEAEHWSENILHPYAGTTSAIGDCLKLGSSNIAPRKGIVVFGYEHVPTLIPLEPAVSAFEAIAKHVMHISLSERVSAQFDSLMHPVHQQGKVFAWELLGTV